MRRYLFLFALLAAPVAAQEYVDLDLPSGTLWATYNIGASFVGDTTATLFRWADLPDATSSDFEEKAFALGEIIQGSANDPATIAWGEEWCTPTLEQWHELLEYCYTAGAYHTSTNGEPGHPQIGALVVNRMYKNSQGEFMFPEPNDPNVKSITFTYNKYVSGSPSYYVAEYWSSTQNMESWPKAEAVDSIWYWTESSYDYYNPIVMGRPASKEHGYAYSFSIRNNNMVFYQNVRPVYEKKIIRAVRKEKKQTPVKPVWAESPQIKPIYKLGPFIIYSNGTKVLER